MKRDALQTLRAVAIEPTYFDLERECLDVPEVVSLISDLGANCIRLGALSHNGRAYYPSGIAPRAPGLDGRDIVGEFARECEKHGIVLGLYSNCCHVGADLATHPGWQIRPRGKPRLFNDEERRKTVNLCHNSPYYDFWLDVTREIVARYRPAFYYIDCFQLMPGCECRFCRQRLRRERGYSVPRKDDWNDPHVQDYLRWVERAGLASARRAFNAVRQANKNTLVVWNRGTFWGRATQFPEDTRFMSTAIGDGYHIEAAVRFYGETFLHIDLQTLIAEAVGRPFFTWVEYPRMPWSHLSSPPVETAIKAAKVFANGARPMMWSLAAAPLPDLRGLEGVRSVYRLAARHAELFDNTKLIADTAVAFSTATSRWCPSREKTAFPVPVLAPPADFFSEFTGQVEALLRAHVPVRVALEGDALRNTSVLVLPNTACMSREQCDRVRRFVRAGGGLVATFETSLYDENGKRRSDFGLADIFGASFVEDGDRASFPNTTITEGMIAGYMLPSGTSDLLGSLPAGSMCPVGCKTLHVRTAGDADSLAHLLRPTRYYCDYPGEVTDWPGVVMNKVGKGICIYLPWLVGRASYDHGLRDIENLISAAARFVRRKAAFLETDLPDTVTLTCRRARSGDVVIHLVNLSGEMKRDVQQVAPVRGCSIALRLPHANGARALVAGRKLATKRIGGVLEIRLPRIGSQEVIHLKRR